MMRRLDRKWLTMADLRERYRCDPVEMRGLGDSLNQDHDGVSQELRCPRV